MYLYIIYMLHVVEWNRLRVLKLQDMKIFIYDFTLCGLMCECNCETVYCLIAEPHIASLTVCLCLSVYLSVCLYVCMSHSVSSH